MFDFYIDQLKKNKIAFLKDISKNQLGNLISYVRKREDYQEIVATIYKNLISRGYSKILFALVYDNPVYQRFVMNYIKKHPEIVNQGDYVGGLMYLDYGYEILKLLANNLNDSCLRILLGYVLTYKEEDILYFLKHSNMHVRAIMLQEMIRKFPEKYYDYVTDLKEIIIKPYDENDQYYIQPMLVSEPDLSLIAVLFKSSGVFDEEYNKLKDYIIATYKSNDLAKLLVGNGMNQEFIDDADRLFLTSKTFKIGLVNKFGQHINSELVKEFNRLYSVYMTGASIVTDYAFAYGLGDKLGSITEKYLDLSHSKDFRLLPGGGCAKTFKIGDYVLKMSLRKHSYEPIICPDLFLTIENLEEIILRDGFGHVKFALEVQKYLERGAEGISIDLFNLFHQELAKLGYYSMDTIKLESFKRNCRYLDDYHDADIRNPEELPDWFKKDPIVLVDRDLVFKLSNKMPKTLISSWEL